MADIPQYPAQTKKVEDPVARSMAKPDACAKPATLGNTRVRVRITTANNVKIRKKKKNHDYRDVHYY